MELQLLSSARGHRHDGTFDGWFPFRALWRHFWPALGVIPFALWRSWQERGQPSPPARNVAALAAERRLLSWPVPDQAAARALPQEASFALVEDTVVGSAPQGWTRAGQGSGWSLWTRAR